MHASKLEVEGVGGRSVVAEEGGERGPRCEEPRGIVRRRSVGRADGAGWCMCVVKNASSFRVPV